MNIQEYLSKNKNIQDVLLDFLESEGNAEKCFDKLCKIIKKHNICDDKNELASFLQLISSISQNHHRSPEFICRIEQILHNLEKDIKNNFTNSEIFFIFENNKRILLFLLEEKMLIMNEFVVKRITTEKKVKAKYPQYFSPEIKPLLKETWFLGYVHKLTLIPQDTSWIKEIDRELPEDFYELRKIGENNSQICNMIRNDSIDEFIIYVTKNNISLTSRISISIYETNPFLIEKQIKSNSFYHNNNEQLTLIKYAAFFGSYQIFKYLQLNQVVLKPQLWSFIIHGKNGILLHLLEENKVDPNVNDEKNEKNSFIECLKVSIKCHHNDIANYFLCNYFNNENEKSISLAIQSLKSYNFSFIQSESINENVLFYLCKYNHYWLLKYLLNDTNIDINKMIIQNSISNEIHSYIFQHHLKIIFFNKIQIIFFNKIQIIFFNKIQNYISMKFKITYFNKILM